MRISHVRIQNFRNFAELDVALAEDAVIVGENKVGNPAAFCGILMQPVGQHAV